MTELARLQDYQSSEPTLVVFNIKPVSFGGQTTILTTDAGAVYRIRVVTVAGGIAGTVGTVRLGLAITAFGGAGQPWTNQNGNSAITATVPQDMAVAPGPNFNYTWSTETTSAYFSQDDSQGWIAQAGIPLVFIPGLVNVNLVRTKSAGGDGTFNVLDGFIQLEKFPLDAVQGQGDQGTQKVYLLSAAKPGDAGSFA
jgi:hypothetical protein